MLFSEFKAFKTGDFLKFFARAPKFRKYEKVKIGTFLWSHFDGFYIYLCFSYLQTGALELSSRKARTGLP